MVCSLPLPCHAFLQRYMLPQADEEHPAKRTRSTTRSSNSSRSSPGKRHRPVPEPLPDTSRRKQRSSDRGLHKAASQVFDSLDLNQDGVISREEWMLSKVGSAHERAAHTAKLKLVRTPVKRFPQVSTRSTDLMKEVEVSEAEQMSLQIAVGRGDLQSVHASYTRHFENAACSMSQGTTTVRIYASRAAR